MCDLSPRCAWNLQQRSLTLFCLCPGIRNRSHPLQPGTAGADGPADEWEEADEGTTWEDYGPRPQVPKGYMLNKGVDYIPFDIRLPSRK